MVSALSKLLAFGRRDATQEFSCTECRRLVFRLGAWGDVPICATCQFIGEHPHLPDDVKRMLRGEKKKDAGA